jgi:hypothetical protein
VIVSERRALIVSERRALIVAEGRAPIVGEGGALSVGQGRGRGPAAGRARGSPSCQKLFASVVDGLEPGFDPVTEPHPSRTASVPCAIRF